MKQGDIARGALESIRSSLKKYGMRRPVDENNDQATETNLRTQDGEGDGSLQGTEDAGGEEREETTEFLDLNSRSGEEEMPEGVAPRDQVINEKPEAQPLRMVKYAIRDINKAIAPGGTRPAAPVHPASTPETPKRPRGRPRKVL